MPVSRLFTAFSALSISMLLTAAIGCGGKDGASDVVSGKVTLSGTPVTGEITFVGADNKEYKSPIAMNAGTYQVIGAPKGEYQVIVKGMGGGDTNMKLKGDVAKGGGDLLAGGSGTAPPAKYGKAGNGLTITVTGGKQEKNFELAP